jgi:hypothetical protein
MKKTEKPASKKRKLTGLFWVLLAMLIAAGAASYFIPDKPISHSMGKQKNPDSVLAMKQPEEEASDKDASMGISEQHADAASAAENKEVHEAQDDISKMFQVDENGMLVLNEKTRQNIESLTALNNPDELAAKLQKLETVLPAQAHDRLVELIDSYNRYITAVKETYPPDKAPANINQALVQLQGLHALRATYFGTETAAAFFEKEEEENRKLLVLMRLQNNELTMEEKAHRAQSEMSYNP